ncbi:hypothetical protein ACFO4O_02180 [Glaciecola siphonariae]|uniref:PEP-CTERM protein-sorting domain-containing protein n=1 Tax=Glaciecola siphonariae TaxID=521012 RepID=A0ABV9LSQ3_9ALTE
MKKQSFIATILLFLSLQANAVIISLDGQEADGAAFNVLNVTNTNSNEVLEISYNFMYEALDPSWATDLIVEIAHLTSGTFFQIGNAGFSCTDFGVECEADLGFLDQSGIFSASGIISLDVGTILDGSGDWEVAIGDSFDDNGVDGVFLAGSFIEITQGIRAVEASSPATLLLLSLTALALFAGRKRVL